ncbi:hypothetical protein JR736_000109 [Escherichia coli]|nr:hypothetical protein [Escherichia coli]
MSQVLITGATGLVGGHLLRMLINEPKVNVIAAPLFRLLPGNWKSIDARDVARVMLAEAMRPEHEGVTILSSSELRKRAE